MPYKVSFHSRFERDVKAFKKDKPVKKLIFEKVQAIVENPDIGTAYERDLLGFYKLSFGEQPEYRLIYRRYNCCQKMDGENECPVPDPDTANDKCEGVVSFVFIRTREECNNLYRREKAYFEGTILEGLPPA